MHAIWCCLCKRALERSRLLYSIAWGVCSEHTVQVHNSLSTTRVHYNNVSLCLEHSLSVIDCDSLRLTMSM